MGDTYHEAHMLVQAEIDAEREAIQRERGEIIPELTPHTLPTIAQVMADKSTSYWLMSALQGALRRDPVDAARDAATLSLLLDRHAEETLRPRGVQPNPTAAAMVSEAAELLEKYGDYELGDL